MPRPFQPAPRPSGKALRRIGTKVPDCLAQAAVRMNAGRGPRQGDGHAVPDGRRAKEEGDCHIGVGRSEKKKARHSSGACASFPKGCCLFPSRSSSPSLVASSLWPEIFRGSARLASLRRVGQRLRRKWRAGSLWRARRRLDARLNPPKGARRRSVHRPVTA